MDWKAEVTACFRFNDEYVNISCSRGAGMEDIISCLRQTEVDLVGRIQKAKQEVVKEAPKVKAPKPEKVKPKGRPKGSKNAPKKAPKAKAVKG